MISSALVVAMAFIAALFFFVSDQLMALAVELILTLCCLRILEDVFIFLLLLLDCFLGFAEILLMFFMMSSFCRTDFDSFFLQKYKEDST